MQLSRFTSTLTHVRQKLGVGWTVRDTGNLEQQQNKKTEKDCTCCKTCIASVLELVLLSHPMMEKQDKSITRSKFTTQNIFFPWVVLPGTWNMQYANKTNSTVPVSLGGHTHAEHYRRRREFFSIPPLKSLLYLGIATDNYRSMTEKSHFSMYFSTAFKETKETDLKTSCWFRSSICRLVHHKVRMQKVQNGLRLIISTATVSRELPPVTWVKIIKEKYVSSLSGEPDYHSWDFRKLIQSFWSRNWQ